VRRSHDTFLSQSREQVTAERVIASPLSGSRRPYLLLTRHDHLDPTNEKRATRGDVRDALQHECQGARYTSTLSAKLLISFNIEESASRCGRCATPGSRASC